MKSLKPLKNKILIKRIEEVEDKTPGGILIPQSAKEQPNIGEVIDIGDEQLCHPLEIGQKVLFSPYGQDAFIASINGEKLLVLNAEDVIGIVEL